MAQRNEPTVYRTELSGRDLLDYVVTLVSGVLIWVGESVASTSTLVFDPTWTAVGVATGLALLVVSTFWGPGRRFQLAMRERRPVFSVAVMAVAIVVFIWLGIEVAPAVRPAHFSWFLGFALSQLVGIGLYLRQRAAV